MIYGLVNINSYENENFDKIMDIWANIAVLNWNNDVIIIECSYVKSTIFFSIMCKKYETQVPIYTYG